MQETQSLNESLGTYLKKNREEKNVSVEQVAYATRISLKMLNALEKDDHASLPAPTFVRGYLQAYAKYLRLDSQDLLLRYQHHLATAPDSKRTSIRSHYLYVRERYQEKRRLVLIIVLFAAMLSVAGTYFMLKAKRERNKRLNQMAEQIQQNPSTESSTASKPSTTTPAVEKTEVKTDAKTESKAEPTKLSTEQKPAEPKPSEPKLAEPSKPERTENKAELTKEAKPTATPAKEEKKTSPITTTPTNATSTSAAPSENSTSNAEKKNYNLLIKASEDVWFRYQTDKDEVRDLTLRTGKMMMIRANEVIKIFSGNLGAMRSTLNGKEINMVSNPGKSKSVVLPESEASKYSLPLFPQFQTSKNSSEQKQTPPPQSGAALPNP